jgi:hypothetical protein
MKKLILVLGSILWAAAASAALAQSAPSTGGDGVPPIKLGVEAGIDLANLNGQNVNDVIASRLGFVGGGFVNIGLFPTLGLQPEILYAQKGGKYNGNPYQADYLEIPILLDVTLVGPVGILLGPSFDENVASSGINNINSADVGLIGGARVNLDRLFLTGRYEVGLTDVSSTQKFQNGTFTFLVGLSFI